MNTLKQTFNNAEQLKKGYLPYLQNGGFFITTHEMLPLAQDVALEIKLPNEADPYILQGKVVWTVPQTAQANIDRGLGVQITKVDNTVEILRSKVESLIAGR